jgi:aldose 1-epimerase
VSDPSAPSRSAPAPAPVRDLFGTLPDGQPVDRWTFTDVSGVSAAVLTYGAVIQSFTVPGPPAAGLPPANIVLGYAELADYAASSYYFGCVVGRYANRVAGGRFRLDGNEYRLPVNDPGRPNALHGGPEGFHRRVWDARPLTEADGDGVGVELSLVSEDGEQGFPGRLEASVRYKIAAGALHIDYRAAAEAATVVNLTNHSFFNLAGEGTGTIDEHILTLDAAAYLPVDGNLIPLPDTLPVAGTPFDFTQGAALGARLDDPHGQLKSTGGYDHCYVLDGGRTDEPRLIGSLADPGSGRVMEVLTTEPGIQLYTANALPADVVGISGRNYGPRAAVALETQHFPDSPNRPDYPSTVLRPGQRYRSTTVLRFAHLA